MKCPVLENPMNGHVEAKERTLGSIAEYDCNDGFILTGDGRVRKCLAGGSWSKKAPFCECKFMCIVSYFSDQARQDVSICKPEKACSIY